MNSVRIPRSDANHPKVLARESQINCRPQLTIIRECEATMTYPLSGISYALLVSEDGQCRQTLAVPVLVDSTTRASRACVVSLEFQVIQISPGLNCRFDPVRFTPEPGSGLLLVVRIGILRWLFAADSVGI